jgi:hypothetical protein
MNKILLGLFFLILGMLFANMLTNICGCKVVEGQNSSNTLPEILTPPEELYGMVPHSPAEQRTGNEGQNSSITLPEILTPPEELYGMVPHSPAEQRTGNEEQVENAEPPLPSTDCLYDEQYVKRINADALPRFQQQYGNSLNEINEGLRLQLEDECINKQQESECVAMPYCKWVGPVVEDSEEAEEAENSGQTQDLTGSDFTLQPELLLSPSPTNNSPDPQLNPSPGNYQLYCQDNIVMFRSE